MEIQKWREILIPYELAVSELEIKFNHMIKESRMVGRYSYIEQVHGRVKTLSSILDKAKRKGIDVEEVTEKICDIAGIRLICQFVEDIEKVVQIIRERSDMEIVEEIDYVKESKPSGYRSYQKQKNIYNNKLKSVGGSEEKADEYVARPGASEHQLGMAMDVGQRNSSAGLTSSFADTKGGAWIAENCWRFGFILRYQEGWEDITGYSYEPWHVRYVGLEHAQAMHEANVPMETYMEDLREQVMIDLLVLE